MDKIIINDLELNCRIGVTEQERSESQRVHVCIEMQTDLHKASETDDLSQTIDYHAVAKQLKALVLQKQWNLIEAMAGDFAKMILQDFKPESVQIEIRKFILSETKWVAVKIVRP